MMVNNSPRKPRKSWISLMPDNERNTFDFIKMLALPSTQKILERLAISPAHYNDLRSLIDETGKTGRTAYHLRRLLSHYCIQKKRSEYHITWKGIKAIQTYKMIFELQNMTIENYNLAEISEAIKIQSTQTWLEPFLEKHIKQILRNCRAQSRSRQAR